MQKSSRGRIDPAGPLRPDELPGPNPHSVPGRSRSFTATKTSLPGGNATQSSTDYDGPPQRAIDGNTNGDYNAAKSTTHTAESADPWWELDLGSPQEVTRLAVWNEPTQRAIATEGRPGAAAG